MGAYTKERASQTSSFDGTEVAGRTSVAAEAFEHFPALPQIANELESYFLIARRIEAALLQETSKTRKYREELRALQQKFSSFSTECENRNQDFSIREERLKLQTSAYQQSEKNLLNEVQVLSRQIEGFQEDRKKTELEI